MQWEPIETAPKDGTEVIACGAYDFYGKESMRAACVIWRNGTWWRDNNGYGFTVQCFPTHWMPYWPPPSNA